MCIYQYTERYLRVYQYLEGGCFGAELLLQLCDLGAGSLTEFGQAGLQSLDILHQLGSLSFFGPELRLQIGRRCLPYQLILETKMKGQINLNINKKVYKKMQPCPAFFF